MESVDNPRPFISGAQRLPPFVSQQPLPPSWEPWEGVGRAYPPPPHPGQPSALASWQDTLRPLGASRALRGRPCHIIRVLDEGGPQAGHPAPASRLPGAGGSGALRKGVGGRGWRTHRLTGADGAVPGTGGRRVDVGIWRVAGRLACGSLACPAAVLRPLTAQSGWACGRGSHLRWQTEQGGDSARETCQGRGSSLQSCGGRRMPPDRESPLAPGSLQPSQGPFKEEAPSPPHGVGTPPLPEGPRTPRLLACAGLLLPSVRWCGNHRSWSVWLPPASLSPLCLRLGGDDVGDLEHPSRGSSPRTLEPSILQRNPEKRRGLPRSK